MITVFLLIKYRNKGSIQRNEVLVWGSNKNYNLGIGNEEGRLTPQQLDYFNKHNIFIDKVSISTYHCMFLDTNKRLYTVGHGNGCQLGKQLI